MEPKTKKIQKKKSIEIDNSEIFGMTGETLVLMGNCYFKKLKDIYRGEKVINKEGFVSEVKSNIKVDNIKTALLYHDGNNNIPVHLHPNTKCLTIPHDYELNEVLDADLQIKFHAKWKTVSELSKNDNLLIPQYRHVHWNIDQKFMRLTSNGRIYSTYELGYVMGSFVKCGKELNGRIYWGPYKDEDEINKMYLYIKKSLLIEPFKTPDNKLTFVDHRWHAIFNKNILTKNDKYRAYNNNFIQGVIDGIGKDIPDEIKLWLEYRDNSKLKNIPKDKKDPGKPVKKRRMMGKYYRININDIKMESMKMPIYNLKLSGIKSYIGNYFIVQST